MTNNKITVNSQANNAEDRALTPAIPFDESSDFQIRELEISVTSICNLTCFGCGFHVPNQPSPVIGKGIDQHLDSLLFLKNEGIRIKKIVVVGGEAALSPRLAEYLGSIRSIGVCEQIELVTNGLYPRGINRAVFSQVDSLVISDYVRSAEFENSWEGYARFFGYQNDLKFRRKPEGGWDDLTSELENGSARTEQHWSTCFYRKYDVTLERGRIFSCSRIAKKQWDDQGLLLEKGVTTKDVQTYLNDSKPKPACYSCATVGCVSKIPVAQQVNSDIDKILNKALKFMHKETSYEN